MYGDLPYSTGNEEIWAAMSAYFACIFIFVLLIVALQIWLFWRVLTKAGFSGWLSLLSLIGGLGTFAILLILAFGEWPAMRAPLAQAYAPPSGGYVPPPTAPAAGSYTAPPVQPPSDELPEQSSYPPPPPPA